MKKKICLSLWSLENLTFRQGKGLFDLLEIAASLGVDGVDIGEDYHRWPPYDTAHGLNSVRKKVHSLGMQILSSWMYTDFVAGVATSSIDIVLQQLSNMLAKCNLMDVLTLRFLPEMRGVESIPKMVIRSSLICSAKQLIRQRNTASAWRLRSDALPAFSKDPNMHFVWLKN